METKSPVPNRSLPQPGESSMATLEDRWDRRVINPAFIAILLAMVATSQWIDHFYKPIPWFWTIVFLVSAVFTGWRYRTTLPEIKQRAQGIRGERIVGQLLEELRSLGCKVYHDIEETGYNIDHVIIAPSGVFAVETKTRRKSNQKNAHRVKYDGQKLIFPEWEDNHGLEQAQRNAKTLSVWLSKAVGESLWVEPILTLPGWLVDRLAKGKVNVLNPKEIIGFISRDTQSTLSPQLIQRISHQLEQRNVIS